MTRDDVPARAVLASTFLVGLAVAACAHDDRRATTASDARRSAPPIPTAPPQYIVADPGPRVSTAIVPLGPSTFGYAVDKSRVIVASRGEPRVAAEQTGEPLRGAFPLPTRMGGGFLFHTDNVVYRSETFDGALKAIVKLPDGISEVSFAPKSVLFRTKNGERWSIAIPSGDRIPINPLGAADVEGLDDGRALAFNDQGTIWASTDHGVHWNDVTASVKSSPNGVRSIDGELWLEESGGGGSRLETDGRLSSFDKLPEEKALSIRAKDPRWHGREPPLRAAFHIGAAIDETVAVVLEGGDLVRVDTRSGELLSVLAGRAPPEATCQALSVGGDVLFACSGRSSPPSGVTSFVLSHTASGDAPVVEQNFSNSGQFYASDDGGLAFSGPCGASQPSNPELVVCVRQLGGTWEEFDLGISSSDAGTADWRVVRWIPRADGRVVAITSEPTWAIVDPRTGGSTPLPPDARDVIERSGMPYMVHHFKRKAWRPGESIIDLSWSATAGGGYRGFIRDGGVVDLGEDGRMTKSPYTFDAIVGGANALGRTKDGRLFQTSDHGGTWTEVATPPGASALDLRTCSSAGCDMGAFYRVGWAVRPPRTETEVAKVAAAPEVRRAPKLELSCRPQGAVTSKALTSTTDGTDFGLGASRVPVVPDGSEWAMIHAIVARTIVSPIHDPSGAGSDGDTSNPRALFTGYEASREGDIIVVRGPNKSLAAARRTVAWVAPFDPSGRIAKTSFGLADVFAAGRAVGLTNDDLQEDIADSGSAILVTPSDAGSWSDIVFNNERGLVVSVRGERSRVAVRLPQNDNKIISAVALDKDETALLEMEGSGILHVWKLGPRGASDLFDLNATASDGSFAPANPDALAVNAKGDLAVLRTPSGSDPASAWDPAYVVSPAAAASPLAPWSELRLADDPTCKGDTSGWHTTLQLVAPWVGISTPELHVEAVPMVARVRWSAKQICLEGLEVRLPTTNVRSGTDNRTVGTYLVSRGSTFARVGIGEGIEWRQNLECSFVKKN